MARKFFILGLFFPTSYDLAIAQELSPIQIDRPDQTECTFIVPKGFVQVESGFSLERINADADSYTYPAVLWKYGLNEHFEFRLITELNTFKTANSTTQGIPPVQVGFKSKISEEQGAWPMVSFISHLAIPRIATDEFRATYFAPSFRFTLQNTLSDRLSLGYNLGAEWDGESAEPVFIYTLTSGISIAGNLGGYVEVYGFAPQKSIPDHRLDGGFTYLINQHMIVDISGGIGLSEISPDYFIAAGFSFRFKV